MEKRWIGVYNSDTEISRITAVHVCERLKAAGFEVCSGYTEKVEMMIVIGGDGTLLNAIHDFDFPDIPMIGINTGHLGFFQELHPDDIDGFIENYQANRFSLQRLSTVRATVYQEGREFHHHGLNEIVIRGPHSRSMHLDISIGGSFIESFSGDGVIISTPAGSTGYNYSLGGSIVDPRLDLLQVTPIAPMNTTAYRSFTSSILLPVGMEIGIVPQYKNNNQLQVINDGFETMYENVSLIEIEYTETAVKLMRFENYDFWDKVKTKFL